MRITRAYCVELDEVVTIDAARREFLSRDPRPSRYNFLCSSPDCRAAEIEITAVNYDTHAEERPKFRAAHFRTNPHQPHLQGCEWLSIEEEEQGKVARRNETDEQREQRLLRRKLTDLVTAFDPRLPEERIAARGEAHQGDGGIRDVGGLAARRLDNDVPGHVRTRDLHRLVETFVEARARLSRQQLSSLTLNVTGAGTVKLNEYFTPLRSCTLATRNRVIYGGATLNGRYGAGFRLSFFDPVEGHRVGLYVSPQELDNYRFGGYIRSIVDKAEQYKYLRVFALGRSEPSQRGSTFNLVVEEMRHLVVRLGEPK